MALIYMLLGAGCYWLCRRCQRRMLQVEAGRKVAVDKHLQACKMNGAFQME